RCPLPCSTRNVMRSLSMSDTFKFATSDTRRPAPAATLSAALYLRPGAASRSRATSSWLSTTGALRGSFTILRGRTRSGRSSVTVKKNRSGDGGVDRPGADLLLRHMQLKAAKIIARRCIRRPAEEGREVPHVANVVLLGGFTKPPRRHVVDHALPQRADGLVGHRESSCLERG